MPAGLPSIGTVGAELAVLDVMGRGAIAGLVIGVLIMTLEFRHQTVTGSLLASPRRGELIAAKAVTAALAGLFWCGGHGHRRVHRHVRRRDADQLDQR